MTTQPRILADYLTVPQLAAELRKVERTIYRMCDQPDGLPYLKVGSTRLFRMDSVRLWLESREHQRNPRPRRGVGRREKPRLGGRGGIT